MRRLVGIQTQPIATKIPMRIGIMLRSIDEKGGVGVYTRNIVKELLHLDRKNEYVLLYREPSNLGLFSSHENVKEIWVKGRTKLTGIK
jgi:hypothetical protein